MRAAVQERVVKSPDEVEVVLGPREEGQTHEGGRGEVETAAAVLGEEPLKAAVALFGRELRPVFFGPFRRRIAASIS